jgi:hypothetical protein
MIKTSPFSTCRQSNPFDPYGLSSAAVTSFAEVMQGDIYIGTDAGKLNLYHRNSGLFTHRSPGKRAYTVYPFSRAGGQQRSGSVLMLMVCMF